jgi:hypothetical protein
MPAKPRSNPVTHAEFDRLKSEVRRLADLLDTNIQIIRANQHNHQIQFQRMSQLQVELDAIKVASEKLSKP